MTVSLCFLITSTSVRIVFGVWTETRVEMFGLLSDWMSVNCPGLCWSPVTRTLHCDVIVVRSRSYNCGGGTGMYLRGRNMISSTLTSPTQQHSQSRDGRNISTCDDEAITDSAIICITWAEVGRGTVNRNF